MSPIPMRSSPPAFYSRSHEHFLLGVHKHPFPRFSPAAWTAAARHGRFDLRAKALAWSEHLLSAPEMRSQAAERPETMHIGNNG